MVFRNWLVERFLPVWAKESVLRERDALRRQVEDLTRENQRLRAYAAGLEYGLRRRITIRNEVNR